MPFSLLPNYRFISESQFMLPSHSTISKNYKLGKFYDDFSKDIDQLEKNCLWNNNFYKSENALKLLNGECRDDREAVSVLAIFEKKTDYDEQNIDHESTDSLKLIAFFPYTIQKYRWLLPLKAHICWWDILIDNHTPFIDKDCIDICLKYLAEHLKKVGGIFVIHQSPEPKIISYFDVKSVHIIADYNHSKKTHKLLLTHSNKTSFIRLKYAKYCEYIRGKLRAILS